MKKVCSQFVKIFKKDCVKIFYSHKNHNYIHKTHLTGYEREKKDENNKRTSKINETSSLECETLRACE